MFIRSENSLPNAIARNGDNNYGDKQLQFTEHDSNLNFYTDNLES